MRDNKRFTIEGSGTNEATKHFITDCLSEESLIILGLQSIHGGRIDYARVVKETGELALYDTSEVDPDYVRYVAMREALSHSKRSDDEIIARALEGIAERAFAEFDYYTEGLIAA